MRATAWFGAYQPVLLEMAKTSYGRDLIGISQNLPEITLIGPSFVRGKITDVQSISEFRTHQKHAKSIRYKGKEFTDLARFCAKRIRDEEAIRHALWRKQYGIGVAGGLLMWATETTFFPDPDPETTSVDGMAGRTSTDQTFADIRAGNGNTNSSNANPKTLARLTSSGTTDQYQRMIRGFFFFDTSSIDDGDTIDAGIFSFDATAKQDAFSLSISLVAGTLASNTDIVNGDYQGTVGNTTKFATDVTIASITTAGATYTDMTMNATGRSNVSKTSITKLGTKQSADADNSEPTWADTVDSDVIARMADFAGTSSDPKLVVTHTAATSVAVLRRRYEGY